MSKKCFFADLADRSLSVQAHAEYAIGYHDPIRPSESFANLARLRVALAKMLARVDGLMDKFAA